MRQVFIDRGDIVVKNVAQPTLDEHSVLVAVHYSFMSPSMEERVFGANEHSFFAGISGKVKYALSSSERDAKDGVQSVGYACSGRVIAIGAAVRKLRVGDFVACAGAGYANHADIVRVPENLVVKISDKKFLKAASLTAVGAIALQSVRRAKIQLGDMVCVIGLDLIGMITAQLAKLSGATVIGIDSIDHRLAYVEQFGIDYILDAKSGTVESDVQLITQNHGVDATIVTGPIAGDATFAHSTKLTRKKGRVVISHDDELHIDRHHLHKQELDVFIACSCGPGHHDPTYEQFGHDYPYAYVRWTENRNMRAFLRSIESGALCVDSFVAQEIPVKDIARSAKQLKSSENLGLVLRYTTQKGEESLAARKLCGQDVPRKSSKKLFSFAPATKAVLSVGLVGARDSVAPIVSRMRNVSIDAVAAHNNAISVSLAQKYGVGRTCSSQELLQSEDVDVVVISSQHKLHTSHTLNALQEGRAVFLQKPLATTFEQLTQIKVFMQMYPQAPLCINYGRSYAPFIKKIASAVQKRRAPLIVHYRVNKGLNAQDTTESDAGRIVGDACEIIDLFCMLTNALPVTVSVEALHAGRDDLFPTDNFVASISFDDGSVCSLTYTSLGNSDSGSERMECFFDGKSIILDDFVGLYGFGLPSSFNDTVTQSDYGQKVLLKTFFNRLRNDTFDSPISFDRLLLSTQLTLIIDQLACAGGGTHSVQV